ncbi:hypothetical protein J6590_075276 [Homalodisca vitripennis]|nr:hypothetical protein J6590_075276 [Homalodisca vitripennis]
MVSHTGLSVTTQQRASEEQTPEDRMAHTHQVVDGVLVSIGNSGTRKRQASGGKRKEAKRKPYSAPSGSNVYIPCKHSTKTLSCSDIRPNDVKKLLERLYKVPEKTSPRFYTFFISHYKER